MNKSLLDHIKTSLATAKKYNSSQVNAPKVLLWPDPERQWQSVIDTLRKEIEGFITIGDYKPELLQGPAIWIKCLIDRTLSAATWSEKTIPIIYLPGISKSNFKNIEEASASIQPLMEYQFTGNLWTQENGKEWTVLAFMQNEEHGMGLEVTKDQATKEAILKSLPTILKDTGISKGKKIDADFLNQLLFPEVIPTLLKWIENGEDALANFNKDQREVFRSVIERQYQIKLDYSLVLDFVRNLGSQREHWQLVWQYFANAPHKYNNIINYLGDAKPEDLGGGLFEVPESSWPQVNDEKERQLKAEILKLKKLAPEQALKKIEHLCQEHEVRLSWIWAELELSPLAMSLPLILEIARGTSQAYDRTNVEGLVDYYITKGTLIDSAVRELFLLSNSKDFTETIQVVIDLFYKPWLEKLTFYFQELTAANHDFLYNSQQGYETSNFMLFVDAFRYDIAQDFIKQLTGGNYKISIDTSWSAIPSLTATSKPSVSPIIEELSKESKWKEFQVQLKSGPFLTQHYFKGKLSEKDINYINTPKEIVDPESKYWMEIGDIDKKGHQEQESMFRRIPELLKELKETIEAIFEMGVKEIQIVTDHGWLLLPGGLPKESLHRDLVETKWGRCALIKEGVNTDLLHLPWTWNPLTYIAFAPGISFFKKNEAYAHGGISLHECLTPLIQIKSKGSKTKDKSRIESFEWRGMRLNVYASSTDEEFTVDIRTKLSDPNSTVVIKSSLKEEGVWHVMVHGDYEEQAATLILIDENGIIVDKKPIQIGG